MVENLLKEMKTLKNNMMDVNMKMEETQAKVKVVDDWPEKHFEKSRDQHEYDTLREIGKSLDLALYSSSVEEALDYIETMKASAKNRLTTLRVAKDYEWDVAAE